MKKYGVKKSSVFILLYHPLHHLMALNQQNMKPALNLSQFDEESEDINELDKCFYEPASIIVTPGKRKMI